MEIIWTVICLAAYSICLTASPSWRHLEEFAATSEQSTRVGRKRTRMAKMWRKVFISASISNVQSVHATSFVWFNLCYCWLLYICFLQDNLLHNLYLLCFSHFQFKKIASQCIFNFQIRLYLNKLDSNWNLSIQFFVILFQFPTGFLFSNNIFHKYFSKIHWWQ